MTATMIIGSGQTWKPCTVIVISTNQFTDWRVSLEIFPNSDLTTRTSVAKSKSHFLVESRNRLEAVCGESCTYSFEGEVSPGNRGIDSNRFAALSIIRVHLST